MPAASAVPVGRRARHANRIVLARRLELRVELHLLRHRIGLEPAGDDEVEPVDRFRPESINRLDFVITGRLKADPMAQQVQFDAELKPSSQHYSIRMAGAPSDGNG